MVAQVLAHADQLLGRHKIKKPAAQQGSRLPEYQTTRPAIPRPYLRTGRRRTAAGFPRRIRGWLRERRLGHRLLDHILAGDLHLAVVLHAGAGRNQAAHDDVLLEAAQVVHLAVDGGFGEHARGLLERRRRDERIGRKRRLGDAEQHRPCPAPGGRRLRSRARFSSRNLNLSTTSSGRNSVSPMSSTFTQRIIWREMTSRCLSLMLTPCSR